MKRLLVLGLVAACGSGATAPRREPAPVCGWQAADWLDRAEREREERPDLLLAALDLKDGDVVADVGAGTGYLTVRLARAVAPRGKVYATDLQPEMLALLRKRIAAENLNNVETIQAGPRDAALPAGVIDVALLVDVYHELADPAAVMAGVRASLRPGGRVVLVEYRAEDPDVPIKPEHKMTVAQVRAELEPMGFRFVSADERLPRQHILTFTAR